MAFKRDKQTSGGFKRDKLATPEGEVGWLTPVDDAMRVAADTMSRGYLDKLMGEESQQHTARSRERLSDWVETPVDVASAVVSSPYRVAGMGAGAIAGGLEGAATAYGHQKDWTPDVGNILWEGGKGAAIGAGGAKIGEKVGEWWGGRQAKEAQPYKTDEALEEASDVAAKQDPLGAHTADLESRVERVRAVRDAQGSGGRDEFAKILSGMTPKESEMASKIASGKSLTTRAGNVADKVGKNVSIPLLISEAVAMGGVPWKTLAGMAVKHGVSKAGKSAWANKAPSGAVEDLAATIRDPSGHGLTPDQATVDQMRDLFAKMGIGYGRAP